MTLIDLQTSIIVSITISKKIAFLWYAICLRQQYYNENMVKLRSKVRLTYMNFCHYRWPQHIIRYLSINIFILSDGKLKVCYSNNQSINLINLSLMIEVIVDHQRSIKGQSIYLKFIWSRAEKKGCHIWYPRVLSFLLIYIMHMFQNA